MQGKVKWFNITKGFGIIEDDNGKSYFIDSTDIKDSKGKQLKAHQKVKFSLDKEDFSPEIPRVKDLLVL